MECVFVSGWCDSECTPLKDRHINFLGRYLFTSSPAAPARALRPFHDPDAIEDDGGED
ncbi:hypothetical protein [Streptomyces swartbergensis]|uniref:hypothetical protein n=1 Tax=Streptomyces swartbergensis TaxID=487165 RepID=UPI00380C3909